MFRELSGANFGPIPLVIHARPGQGRQDRQFLCDPPGSRNGRALTINQLFIQSFEYRPNKMGREIEPETVAHSVSNP